MRIISDTESESETKDADNEEKNWINNLQKIAF